MTQKLDENAFAKAKEAFHGAYRHPDGPLRGALTAYLAALPPPAGDVGKLADWANEAARYFEKRPTNGEDSAHWANVYNAENARKVAAALTTLSARAHQTGRALILSERRVDELTGDLTTLSARLAECERERDEARAKLNAPELHNFAEGVVLEAAHQRERWGAQHDAGKQPPDWFWLIGYLAGKALTAHMAGNAEKALHHTISTAAACANWHSSISGANTAMRPGIDAVARGLEIGGSHV